jgi:Zn-dependent alcohol dehydrogenase
MSQTVRGVVSRQKGAPVELVDIVVPDPGPGEVVVEVSACAVGPTDLTYRQGGINDQYPFLLGHAATGVVEVVGEGVTHVAPGDFVILNWRAVCGHCRACTRGRPQQCVDPHNADQKMTLTNGTELTPAFGIGALTDKTLVHQNQCTTVDSAVLEMRSPAIANSIAALLIHLRDTYHVKPNVYFQWSEGDPLLNLLRFLILGVGEIAPVTREVLRRAEPDPSQRPTVHVS